MAVRLAFAVAGDPDVAARIGGEAGFRQRRSRTEPHLLTGRVDNAHSAEGADR
jgi:hypothetical protein